jgi:hypothetical protein
MVEKVASRKGDTHPTGSVGRVSKYLGEVTNPVTLKKVHGYIVQWDLHGDTSEIYDDGRLAMLRTTN